MRKYIAVLLLGTLFGASCSGEGSRESDALLELGKYPATFFTFEEGELRVVNGNLAFDDRSLSLLSNFDSIENISLLDSKVSGEGLRKMGNRETLLELSLTGSVVIDEDLEVLTEYERLEDLELNGSQVTNACIPFILRMKNLKRVGLSRNLTDEGFERLQSLRPDLDIDY